MNHVRETMQEDLYPEHLNIVSHPKCYDLLCYHYHNYYHPTHVASCPVSSPHAKCRVRLSVVVTMYMML
jgi:hypothetical protein